MSNRIGGSPSSYLSNYYEMQAGIDAAAPAAAKPHPKIHIQIETMLAPQTKTPASSVAPSPLASVVTPWGPSSAAASSSAAPSGSPLPSTPFLPSSSPLKAAETPLSGNEQLHYLVVDDNVINQRIAKKQIESISASGSFTIDTALNGVEAVNLATARDKSGQLINKYHLIIMDLSMPIMNGDEATRLIRKAGSDVPIIYASTPKVGEKQLTPEEQTVMGFTDSMLKPYTLKILEDTVVRNLHALRVDRGETDESPVTVPLFRSKRQNPQGTPLSSKGTPAAEETPQ